MQPIFWLQRGDQHQFYSVECCSLRKASNRKTICNDIMYVCTQIGDFIAYDLSPLLFFSSEIMYFQVCYNMNPKRPLTPFPKYWVSPTWLTCSWLKSRDAGSMLDYCWATVADGGATVIQHRLNVPVLNGRSGDRKFRRR